MFMPIALLCRRQSIASITLILKKPAYFFIIVLLCLFGCRQQPGGTPPTAAVRGVIDLSDWDLNRDGPVKLSGEYEFYWQRLLDPPDLAHPPASGRTGYIHVPQAWSGQEFQARRLPSDGFATYRLQVLLNGQATGWAVKITGIGTSFNLFVNGRKISSGGIVGKTADAAKPISRSVIVEFKTNENLLDIILQVSNFSHRIGGIWGPLVLGTPTQLQRRRELHIAYDFFLFGSILIMALYHLGLFSMRRKDRSSLLFGLFCLIIALRILNTDDRYLLELIPGIPYETAIKLEYLTFYLAVPVFIRYIYSLFAHRYDRAVCFVSDIVSLAFCGAVIMLPVRIFSRMLPGYQIFSVTIFFIPLAALVAASIKKDSKALIFLAGFVVLFLFSVNDILYANNILQTGYLVQFGLFVFIFSQAYLLSRNFSQAFTTIETQKEKLKFAEVKLQRANDRLEKRVRERTTDILEANTLLRQEIEERRRAQEATREARIAAEIASNAKTEFLANMSHELRTPLNHILGFTELVLDKNFGELNELQEEYLGDVHRSSKHLLSLINEILDLAKVDSGKLELQLSDVNLKALLSSSLTMVKEKTITHEIQFNLELTHIPDKITADERKINQVMYNLLSNAVKFTPPGGNVSIKAETCSPKDADDGNDRNGGVEKVKVSIYDTGIGIGSDDLERIFNPFEQVDQTATRRFQGTGLGLSLSKRFVELHNGEIWAESSGEGRGSAFHFFLPVKQPER